MTNQAFSEDQYITIMVAGSPIYCVQRVDGSRELAADSFCKAVDKTADHFRNWRIGKSDEAQEYKDAPVGTMKGLQGNRPMLSTPVGMGVAFWFTQAFTGNKEAQALTRALAQETLDVRIDNVLGTPLTMAQVEIRTTENRELIRKCLELATFIDQSELSSEELEEELEAKGVMIKQMTDLEFDIYYAEVSVVFDATRAKREALLPAYVQEQNIAIANHTPYGAF